MANSNRPYWWVRPHVSYPKDNSKWIAANGEHEDSLRETKMFRNEFLRGGLDDSAIAGAVSGFDTAGYGRMA